MCRAFHGFLAVGSIFFFLALRHYHARTKGQYRLIHKFGWYFAVAVGGVAAGYGLRSDPNRCLILALVLAAFPLYAWLDTYVIYRETGRQWGMKFFLAGCFAELYVVSIFAELSQYFWRY